VAPNTFGEKLQIEALLDDVERILSLGRGEPTDRQLLEVFHLLERQDPLSDLTDRALRTAQFALQQAPDALLQEVTEARLLIAEANQAQIGESLGSAYSDAISRRDAFEAAVSFAILRGKCALMIGYADRGRSSGLRRALTETH